MEDFGDNCCNIVGQDLLEDTEHGSKILGLHQDLQADAEGGGYGAVCRHFRRVC